MSNLPPIKTEEYAFKEEKEIELKKCKHKDVLVRDGVLRCKCGAAWSGSNIDKLYKLLTTQE